VTTAGFKNPDVKFYHVAYSHPCKMYTFVSFFFCGNKKKFEENAS
jgi:hypothetical protein